MHSAKLARNIDGGSSYLPFVENDTKIYINAVAVPLRVTGKLTDSIQKTMHNIALLYLHFIR